MNKTFVVQVVYATRDRQALKEISVAEGCTLEEAVSISGLLDEFPELDSASLDVGVFSERRQITDVVRAGDRIEIYRPLVADPKEIRRRRAKKSTK